MFEFLHPYLDRRTLGRRLGGSLAFGFILTFAFATLVQVITDILNWIFHMQIRFLFPFGLSHALDDPKRLLATLTSLVFTSLVLTVVFFIVRGGRSRRSILEFEDEEGPGD